MLLKIFKFGSQIGMDLIYKRDICPAPLLIKENISYATDDLDEHKLDIIYPSNERDSYPFIINIHGGSFSMHSKEKLYRNYGMRLAGNKFAVVNINYRLAPDNIYPTQVEDVLMAIKFISRNACDLKLDKNNMFIIGGSAGAYLAAITACILSNDALMQRYGFYSDVVCRAIAANSGMYDFTTLMDKDISFPMKRKMIEILFGRRDFANSLHYPYSSVLTYVNGKFPPTYLMDTKKQSFEKEALRFADVLKKHNVNYKLHIFEKKDNLIHAFNIISKYPQSHVVLEETFAFFNANLAK